MAKKIGIGVIHGMGTHEADFADEMIAELNKRLVDDENKNANDVAFQAIHWSDVLSGPQQDYLDAIKAGANVDYVKLRGFMIKALGDASGYQKSSTAGNTYAKIHEKIRDAIGTLRTTVGDDTAPLMIMAHSLGGHMISNYIYDLQQGAPVVSPGNNDFEKFHTLAGMVTFGCNIPLFTFSMNPVVAIDFPATQIAGTALANKAKWYNYYDPDDVLGYPLKLIGRPDTGNPPKPNYNDVVDEDRAINVGGFISSWNPTSHSKYWTDNDFTKPVARQIANFL